MKKRMRIFAGPNGSGKTSVIKSILNTEVQKGKKLDFGIYINADDIATTLRNGKFNFQQYGIHFLVEDFLDTVSKSGLISADFTEKDFSKSLAITGNSLFINWDYVPSKKETVIERIAQILADFLRKKLIAMEVKFSFETVFSHHGKVEIIKLAKELGYKVYLYFVSTEHPDINVFRVKNVRVPLKGHDVPEEKIRSRYLRSMDLLYEAAQHCYQCYFFDNSKEGQGQTLFAHFKLYSKGEKVWEIPDEKQVPNWFKQYYSAKINAE